MTNGSHKGSRFERQVAVSLSLWASEGKRKDMFWRSAGSGSRATLASRRGTSLRNQAGDISSLDARASILTDYFMIECKHWETLHLGQAVIQNTGKLVEFWQRLVVDAQAVDKLPMLIAKQDYLKTFIVLSGGGCQRFNILPYSTLHRGSCPDLCILPFAAWLEEALLDNLVSEVASGRKGNRLNSS